MSAPADNTLGSVSRFRRRSSVACDTWKVDAIGFAVAGAFTVLIYLLGISPLLERHARVQAQRADLTAAHQKAADLNQKVEDFRTRLALAQGELTAAPLKLQPSTLLNQRLALVTDLVSQNGAAVDDIQPGKVVAGARFDTVTMRLAGTASYCTFTALLHRLREEFPDIGVAAFDVAGNPQETAGSAKFSVDLVWYTKAASGPITAPEKSAPAKADK